MSTRDYVGKDVTIRYDARRCIHAEECVHGAPAVFDPQAKPWIQPDNASVEHLVNVVARCPSGALTLHAPDGTSLEAPPESNTAAVQARGPIYVRARVTVPGGRARHPGRVHARGVVPLRGIRQQAVLRRQP